MKKLLQINTVCNTSTGRIMHDIQMAAEKEGYNTLSCVGRRKCYTDAKCVKFGNVISFWLHVFLNTVFDCQGKGSYFTTKKLIRILRREKPDIIHLHNLHGYYLNLQLLFRYLREEYQGKVFWTFHDCWPMTGHCAYFTMANCNKWIDGCDICPQKKQYPISLFMDRSRKNYLEKKNLFTAIDNLTVIVPSEWMKNIVEKSYFCNCDIQVVHNGIDLDVFSPCVQSEIDQVKQKYQISKDTKIILGVANIWETRKGLNIFKSLSLKLPEDYQVILVGLTKKQSREVGSGIIGIERMRDRRELASLYSAADIFVNPSMEESFSLVTVEAMACGTPVIALGTSAVKELVSPETGIVVEKNESDAFVEAIQILMKQKLNRKNIAKHAMTYSKETMTQRILSMYVGLQ